MTHKANKNVNQLSFDETFPFWIHLSRSIHKSIYDKFDIGPGNVYCAWKYQHSPILSKK